PTSDRSTKASWLMLRTLPTLVAATERNCGARTGLTSVSENVSLAARAGMDRHCRSAHEPSSSAAKESGRGSPFAIRQLGSTIEDPAVHHRTSGSDTAERRCDSSAS